MYIERIRFYRPSQNDNAFCSPKVGNNLIIAISDELPSDPGTLELYETAIRDGTERNGNIRVMIVGSFMIFLTVVSNN